MKGNTNAQPNVQPYVRKGYTKEIITMASLPGITITKSDNIDDACRVIYNDNTASFQFSFGISGTFTGTSGWQSLYNSSVYDSSIPPYLIYVPVQSGHWSILWGKYVYLSNGESVNTQVRFTLTVPRNTV